MSLHKGHRGLNIIIPSYGLKVIIALAWCPIGTKPSHEAIT